MLLPLKIALRYLFSHKSHSAINAVSIVSVCGVAVATMALICTLSVYNGFNEIISFLYSDIDPELEIKAKEGKTIDSCDEKIIAIEQIEGIECITPVIEENALAVFGETQQPVTLRGVPANYSEVNNVNNAIIDGIADFSDSIPRALIGVGVSNTLMVAPAFSSPIQLYSPKRMAKVNLVNPSSSFNRAEVYCSGVFSISQPEYDDKLIYLPIEVTKHLFDYTSEITELEIKIKEGYNINRIKTDLSALLGDRYEVKDRMEQNSETFSMMAIEKWITFLILMFILMIASFNIVGSVSMLIIDKKSNIAILYNIGATENLISRIFFWEGMLITIFGTIIGMLFGLGLSLVQQHFGLLKMGSNFIVEAYPVKVIWSDILYTMLGVGVIGILTAWYPVKYINSKFLKETK